MVAISSTKSKTATNYVNKRLATKVFILISSIVSLIRWNGNTESSHFFGVSNNRVSFQAHSEGQLPTLTPMTRFAACPVTSIRTLPEAELEPRAGSRHMVDPPRGGKLTLICCETTKGHISALLHHAWAPLGVARLVAMIHSNYFSTKIPLFRCTDACQFGLSGDPNVTKQFESRLDDDPMWLPSGRDHQRNDQGVKRYPEGMWTYAGAGPNTRSNQFVITLKPNRFMGGGSPWEVPIGELVGSASFDVLPRLYNGYGERGPGQGLLRREGNSERVQKEWPLMDYILSCTILDERTETTT